MSATLQFALIGCGLIGQKRVNSLRGRAVLTVCCDVQRERAESIAKQNAGTAVTTRWEEAVGRDDVDAVFVCTSHDLLAPIAELAALCGKHVLVEKPGGRRAAELDPVLAAAEKTGVRVRVGFNHRYHRAIQKARDIVDSGSLEELLYIRGRYGHGGRVGYDREWRAVPEISGGGEAIDQGIHLLDLAGWFLGDLNLVGGSAPSYFWKMPVEDNAFFLLETDSHQVAFLHASWTEWKNLFSFEICGRMGKLEITGLGGSYGTERIAHYEMLPQMGPPPTTIYEYPMPDDSWERELEDFLVDVRLGRTPQPGIAEAQAALRIVEQLYANYTR
jgi:predicted dehydrogenase